jgi:hypothetical protein
MAMRTLLAAVLCGALAAPGLAQAAQLRAVQDADWCNDEYSDNQRERTCTVYEGTWAPAGPIAVDARPNGGIQVQGWNRNEVRLRAKVVTMADDEAEAQRLASEVQIQTDGTIRAQGPARAEGRHRSWWVSYRLDVPENATLSLESTNGGIHLQNLSGDLSFTTTNGGLHLKDLGGKVNGRTTNGGVHVALTGSQWQGEGLDVTTTNGGVHISVPNGYNAHLEVGTTNGRVHANVPGVHVADEEDSRGRRRHRARTISTELGRGGAPIRVRTTNGGVHLNQD